MSAAKTSKQYYLGIDPSAASSGLGLITVVNGAPQRWDCTTITPPDDFRGARRLSYIFNEARQFLTLAGVRHITRTCIEGAALHSTNRETILSQVRGIFLLLAYRTGECEPTELAPTQIKKFAAGNGGASKKEVMAAIISEGNWHPQNDDEADGCAAANIAHALDYHETTRLTRPQLELTLQLLQGKTLKTKLVPQSRRQLNV